MRVLVTGHRGYIGSVMVAVLRHARYEVVGLDCDFFEGCDFGRVRESVPSFEVDLRDLDFTDLLSFDAVIHLAAVPSGPQGFLDPSAVQEINEEATVRLALACKQAHVSRFLFASSWTVYGRNGTDLVDETTPADPITPEGASKYRCERALRVMADDTFTPVFLRHGSVYGVSPRLRTDVLVNDFVASALTIGRTIVRDNGLAWYPVVHVEDLCRAYAAMLSAPDEDVRAEAFNTAASGENYRLVDIADMVAELTPFCTRSIERELFEQPSCRLNGTKLCETLPALSLHWTLPAGVRQLRTAMLGAGLTAGDCRSDRFRRAARLESLMERGDLSRSLRCRQPVTT